MIRIKTGDPCPCCGRPVKLTDPEALRMLSILADILGLPEVRSEGETDHAENCGE